MLMRRKTAFALALAMCLAAFPVSALAEVQTEDTGDAQTSGDTQSAGKPIELKVRDLESVHEPLVRGYENGSFGLNEKLTRAQAAYMYCELLETPPELDNSLPDVPEDAWYSGAANLLTAAGAMETVDGEFRGAEPMTRAEFVTLGVRLLPNTPVVADAVSFDDVPTDYKYYNEITLATRRGWVQGTEGSFRPEDPISRAEAVTFINRFLGRTVDKNYLAGHIFSLFSDVSASNWAYYEVMEASIPHSHAEDGSWTEADMSAILKEPGPYFQNGELYYIGEDGKPIVNGSFGGLQFGPDGKFSSGSAELDGYVKDTLAAITDDTMTREEKLHAAYNFTRDSFKYLRRNYYEVGDTSWANKEAITMFTTKRGNCYCYAAVFYSLARQLGYDAVLISGKVNNSNPVPHGWVEIWEGDACYMYDAELEMSYRVKGNYSYDFYRMASDKTPWKYWR